MKNTKNISHFNFACILAYKGCFTWGNKKKQRSKVPASQKWLQKKKFDTIWLLDLKGYSQEHQYLLPRFQGFRTNI